MDGLSASRKGLGWVFALAACLLAVCMSHAVATEFDEVFANHKDYYKICINNAIKTVRKQEATTTDEASENTFRALVNDVIDSLDEHASMQSFLKKLTENYTNKLQDLEGEKRNNVETIMNVYLKDLKEKVKEDHWITKWHKEVLGSGFKSLPAHHLKYNAVCLDYAIEDKSPVDVIIENTVRTLVEDSLKGKDTMQDFILELFREYRKKIECEGDLHNDVKAIMKLYIKNLIKNAGADVFYMKWIKPVMRGGFDQLAPPNKENDECLEYAVKMGAKDKSTLDEYGRNFVEKLVHGPLKRYSDMQDFMVTLITSCRDEIRQLPGDTYKAVNRIMEVYVEDIVKKADTDVLYNKWQKHEMWGRLGALSAYHKYHAVCIDHSIKVWLQGKLFADGDVLNTVEELTATSLRKSNWMESYIINLTTTYRTVIRQLHDDKYNDVKTIIELYVQDLINKAGEDLRCRNWELEIKSMGLEKLNVRDYGIYSDCLDRLVKVQIVDKPTIDAMSQDIVQSEDKPTIDTMSQDIVENLVTSSFYERDSMYIFFTKLIRNYKNKINQLYSDEHDNVKTKMKIYVEDFMKTAKEEIPYRKKQEELRKEAMKPGFNHLSARYNDIYVKTLAQVDPEQIEHKSNTDLSDRFQHVSEIVMDSAGKCDSMKAFILDLITDDWIQIKNLPSDERASVIELINVYLELVIKQVKEELWYIDLLDQGKLRDLNKILANKEYIDRCLEDAIQVRVQQSRNMAIASRTTVENLVNDSFTEIYTMQIFIEELLINYSEKIQKLKGDIHDDVLSIMKVYVKDLIDKAHENLIHQSIITI